MASPNISLPQQGVVVQKPKSDVYTVMLIVSWLAIVISIIFLWVEMGRYNYDYQAAEAAVRTSAGQ